MPYQVEKAAFTVVLLADLKADIHKSSDLLKNAAPEISGYADAIPGMVPIFAGENGKNTMTEASALVMV